MRFRFALLTSAALFAAPALADTAEPSAPGAVQVAQAAGGEEEVTVTARRRQERAQAVPLAISVVTASALDDTGNFNVVKLQQLVPALQVYSSNPRNTSVNIRGLGVPFGLTSDGHEQGVGIYIDDVYNARVAAATFDFLDVSRVEVLRGPQGTLYGKNTTAGAINITTNAPTFDFESRAEVSIGNIGFRQAKAAISGPLSETIAIRIAASLTTKRGTIYNVTSRQWINGQDNLGLRAQILFKPNANFELTLAGDFSAQDPECCGTVFVRTGLTQRPLARQFEALAALQNYVPVSRNPFDRLSDVDANLNAGNDIGGLSARIKWNVAGGTLTSVTAWRFWDWKPENDRDFTGLPVVSRSQNPSQQNQYSQEFRFDYTGESFDFVVGLFGFDQRIDTQGTEQQGAAASRWNLTGALAANPDVLNGLTASNTQSLESSSVALFGQLSWRVTDALTIQPGLRINYDKKSGFYQRVVTAGDGTNVTCPQPAGTIGAARCGIYQPQVSAPSVSEWNLSYDLTVSYRFAPDVLAFATYARSFKTAGINQNGPPADANNNPILAAGTIRPEQVDNYEAGLKTQLWDRKITFNLTAFRTDITDFQATVTNGQFGVLRGFLANAGQVRSQGVEADFQVRPSDNFSAYFNAAWTDAKYVRFVDAPCPPELAGGPTVGAGQTPGAPGTPGGLSPANCDISGQRLPGVSKWTLSYGAELTDPAELLGESGEIFVGADGTYRSGFSSNASPSIYTNIEGYALTNFRFGFRGERFEIAGWVRNAFDTEYLELLQVAPGNVGLIVGQPGDPRTWGTTLRFSF